MEIHPWNCSLDLLDLTLVKKSNKIPVPFFQGPQVRVILQWNRVIHFDLLSKIVVVRPVVNFVNGPTEAESQTALEPEWVKTVKQLVPLRINYFHVVEGDLHYRDFHAQPEINMEYEPPRAEGGEPDQRHPQQGAHADLGGDERAALPRRQAQGGTGL